MSELTVLQENKTQQQVHEKTVINTQTKSNKKTKREKIADRYQWRCYWCGCGLRRELGYQNSATIEHLVPKSQGGPDRIWNLAAACRRCNHTRGTMPINEFELLAKTFSVDKRPEEHVRNAAKKAQRRAANAAAIARKAARLRAEQMPVPINTIDRAKNWIVRVLLQWLK